MCRDSCRNPTVTAGLVRLRVSVCSSVPIPARPPVAQAAPAVICSGDVPWTEGWIPRPVGRDGALGPKSSPASSKAGSRFSNSSSVSTPGGCGNIHGAGLCLSISDSEGLGGSRDSAFPASSLVTLMLHVWGHRQNHWARGRQGGEVLLDRSLWGCQEAGLVQSHRDGAKRLEATRLGAPGLCQACP